MPGLMSPPTWLACVAQAEVRRKATECIAPLMEACGGHEERQLEVLRTVTEKLFDQDEGVRKAAVAAVCAVLQQHPRLAISTATNGRGRLLHCLSLRLRDKKVAVRREVASQMAALVRTWALAAAEGGSGGGGGSTAGGGASPETQTMLAIPVVLCNCGVRDPELRGHIFDTVFRAGIFPAKLAPADVARYWAQLWFQAGVLAWAGLACARCLQRCCSTHVQAVPPATPCWHHALPNHRCCC